MIIRRALVILLMMNAAATFLVFAGSGAVWGVEMQTGIQSEVEQVNQSAQTIGSGPVGLIEAVGGLAVAAVSAIVKMLGLITVGGPMMLGNIGVPDYIVAFVFGPIYVVVALDLITIIRGGPSI